MSQSTTAAAERTDTYFTKNVADFEIITKCGRKAPAVFLNAHTG
jgi:hypothetical protein